MTYLIQSKDGRHRICTYSAALASQHAENLLQQGHAVVIRDLNGQCLTLSGLRRLAEAA